MERCQLLASMSLSKISKPKAGGKVSAEREFSASSLQSESGLLA
jgi:hypothetical protein